MRCALGGRLVGAMLVVALVQAPGCRSGDPRARLLEERARWTATLLSWAQSPGPGPVTLAVRVSGPPRSKLDRLTVRVQLHDGAGSVVSTVWHTFDLTDVEGGGPADRSIRVPVDREVHGASVDSVPSPTEAEQANLPELTPTG